METETPETDAVHHAVIHGSDRFSFPSHARRMERERNEARREAEKWRDNAMNGWDGGYRVEFSWENAKDLAQPGRNQTPNKPTRQLPPLPESIVSKTEIPMIMIYEEKFRKGVKAFRERSRLTIPQAAERIGTSAQMIEWWEKGERTPNLRIFYTICAAYECSPNDILEWPDATFRKLESEHDRLLSAMREIVACGLNCKDALDEAEQMERIAKEALSSANAIGESRREGTPT